MTATIFSAVLTCAAARARGSGSSSTEHCRWCSGDNCRWCSRIHSVELQVVQQRDFSGAADDSNDIFSGFDVCSCACTWQWQQQHRALQVVQWRQLQVVQQSTFSGAAGGGSWDGEAAGAGEAADFEGGCGWRNDAIKWYKLQDWWWHSEISVKLQVVQRYFQRF